MVTVETTKAEQIARVCHEANRAYCATLGDFSQAAWEDAPDWQHESAIHGAEAHLAGILTPEQSHELWLKEKTETGWSYGDVKDAEKKTHPCFRPYAELPEDQRRKDALFKAVVEALR